MSDRALSSELPAHANSKEEIHGASESDAEKADLKDTEPAIDQGGNRIYFMNLTGRNSEEGVYLTKVTIEDKDDLTGEGREVLQKQLSSPVELAYRALHLLPALDIDDDGIVSRTEMENAAKDSKYTGTDAQVIAGLSEPSVWNRIANFSNDQRGKETGLSSEDAWIIAERQDDVAVQTAFAAAIASYHPSEMTAGK